MLPESDRHSASLAADSTAISLDDTPIFGILRSRWFPTAEEPASTGEAAQPAPTDDPPDQGSIDGLIARVVDDLPGVVHGVRVSVSGQVIEADARLPHERAAQLAAVSAGLVSLASGAARLLEGGSVLRSTVEMEQGHLLVLSLRDESHLAVLTSHAADIVAVEGLLASAVEQVGQGPVTNRARQDGAAGAARQH